MAGRTLVSSFSRKDRKRDVEGHSSKFVQKKASISGKFSCALRAQMGKDLAEDS